MDSVATADKNHSPLSPPSVSSHQTAHYWTQLNGCADSLAFASTIEKSESFQLIVTADTPSALRYEHEIGFFQTSSTPVLHFPDWETLPYDVFSPLPEIISERLRTLSRLPQVRKGVLVVSIATLMHRISPRQHILASTFVLERGGRLDLDETRSNLEHVGYQCVPQVYQHGEFAVRGSIIDLFPMGNSAPYRIELFDDEIESIRTFDPESQRSLEKVDNINLFPAREFPFTDEAIKQYRQAFRNYFPNTDTRCSLYQDVTQGILPGGIEYYLPLFVEKTDTLFDYLPKDTTLVLTEEVQRAAREFQQEIESRFEQRRHDTSRPILAPKDLYLSPEKLFGRMENYARVYINSSEAGSAADSPLVFSTQSLPDLSLQSGPNQVATEALESFLNGFPGKTLFVAETAGHREMLLETLRRHEIKPVTLNQWSDFLSTDEVLSILVAPIDHGLWMANPAIAIITETQLTGERAQQRRRRRRSSALDLENIVANLSELQIGAPVVHRDHGIGRYAGLNRLTVGAVDTEFLTLEYANNDKLYVPVASLHLIGRYSGGDPDLAPIHRLGGDQWQKAKKRAMEKARDVAVELLDSHAKRAARQGFSFEVGGDEYETFALAFPFEETPDQQTAIDQVVEDMLSDKAMDRVVCGDVGFGKTEVAMRAAFVAVENNKQVAILVPTTLLAQQHFQSFIDRFVDWPVRIEVLSRFVPKKKQNQILKDLMEGKVDILIGTHKIVQSDVNYKNLGLVVIDEEHRFGVRHKEHFKKLRSEVDLLTLTATPIPRTLNMSLSGLRDISIMASPPPNRHPIKTFVSEWVDSLVQEAGLREIKRGGQVFFLHNNVKTIEPMADEIRRLLPEARLEIAHGQMPERELERIMLDFYHQRFNLLLCTTIIESGIDVPSANTIIINRADKLGLAQLHQLRGRVGRSHHRAYAYLLTPSKKLMTSDAVKRLRAIEAAGNLGAGFMLSSHDLEIRGAGELLGEGQSGQINEIGFTLYTELLERAVEAIKSGKQPELEAPLDVGPEVDLQLSALIPDDYLPDVHSRLVLYKRISSAESVSELDDLQVEMIDRFGMLPEQAKHLFIITEIKIKAAVLGIRKIEANDAGGRILFTSEPTVDPGTIIRLIQSKPAQYKLDGPDKLRFTQKLEQPVEKINFVKELLETLRRK